MCNVFVIGIPEGGEKEKGTEKMFETTRTENFPKLMSYTKPQVQESQRTPNRINVPPKMAVRHIIFKLQKMKDREKILKEVRKNKNHLLIRIIFGFSSETRQTRGWNELFEVQRKKKSTKLKFCTLQNYFSK